MVREIKYRAWDKAEKRMLQVERIDWDFNTGQELDAVYLVPPEEECDHLELSIHDVELLEFTGLKDAVGVEIYENDILDVDRPGDNYRMVCKWIEEFGCFMFCFKIDSKPKLFGGGCLQIDQFGSLLNKKSKVLGNVYENPELLEES